ncbi:thiamine-phosphate kinase, partial [Halobium palmae]
PVDPSVEEVVGDEADRRELAAHFGEDFELVFTVPESSLAVVREASPTAVTRIGTTTAAADGVVADGEPLPDRGYTHSD